MYRKRLPYQNLNATRGGRKPSVTSEFHRKIHRIFAVQEVHENKGRQQD